MLSKSLFYTRKPLCRAVYSAQIKGLATSTNKDDDYEIDLISLKKTPKKPKSPATTWVQSTFEQLSYFEAFNPSKVNRDFVRQSITTVKSYYSAEPLKKKKSEAPNSESVAKDAVNSATASHSTTTNPDKGYLEFVEKYSQELEVFLKFITVSYNSKITSFGQLTSVELLNSLYIFKNYYQNNKIKDVNKYNFTSYNYMFGRFVKYLTNNPKFPSILTNELIPYANDLNTLEALYNDGIGNFLDELHSLSNEFDFSKLTTCLSLSEEINKTLDQFTRFLAKNQKFNEFQVDPVFFKILIQINRYKSLKKVLDANAAVGIRHLNTILNDKDSSRINTSIKESAGISTEIRNTLTQVAPYYQLLRCVKGLEISDYDSFIESAPTLYNLAKEKDEKIISTASFEVLQSCLSLFNSGLVSAQDSVETLKYLTAGNSFGPSDLIKVVDPPTSLQNYELTIFRYSGLFDSLDTLRLLRSYSGRPFTQLSFEDMSKSLEQFLGDKSVGKFTDDVVNIDNGLHWFAYYVPWSDLSVFDTVLDNRGWVKALAQFTDESDHRDFGSSPTPAIHGSLNPILKGFKEWLGGYNLGYFGSSHLVRLFDKFKDENEYALSTKYPSKEFDQVSLILKEHSEKYYFSDGIDAFLKGETSSSTKQYVQIPDDLELHKFVKEITILRNEVLRDDFKHCSPSEILDKLGGAIESAFEGSSFAIDEDSVFEFIRLRKRLFALFDLNGGHTEVLDVLLKNNSVFELVDSKIEGSRSAKITNSSNEYVQIPEELELDRFYEQLQILRDDELKKPFKNATVQEVQSLLSARIDELYGAPGSNSNPNSRMTHENVFEFVKLSRRLATLFQINSRYVGILDTLIYNHEVAKDLEEKLGSLEPKPYLQISDDLELHKFTSQLTILKEDELKKPFADSSASEIHSILDRRINEVINGESTNSGSRLTNDNVYEFVKLSKRLTRLLDYNGGYTPVLDTLIHSQAVFEDFEKRIKQKLDHPEPNVYKPLPDDFFLEEYIAELIQLKNQLGGKYSSHSSRDVLTELDNIANQESSPEKRLVWRKLYRNLAMLFRHNNNNTFVLDAVLINSEAFLKFESNKAFSSVGIKNENSLIGANSKLLNNFFEHIENFLIQSQLLGKGGIWELSDVEFNTLLEKYAATLDTKSYDYPSSLHMIEELKNYNSRIEYYPNFLQQLYEIKSNNLDELLSASDVELIYKAFIENIEYETEQARAKERLAQESRARIAVPTFEGEAENKFDMNEFKDGKSTKKVAASKPVYDIVDDEHTSSLKSEYNDSERLLSLLSKSEEPVDLANNDVLKHHFAKEGPEETDIRDAVSIALSRGSQSYEPERKPSQKRNFKESKSGVTAQEGTESSASIDKSSLESFLKDAKKENDLAKERKFREAKAFEWSSSMSNSHRSLESQNFFDPLNSGSVHDSGILFFPPPHSAVLDSGNLEYLLLTVDGQVIKSHQDSIGKIPQEDIFKILNKFDKEELGQFIKHFKKLQRKNWKLVGSKIEENTKYLILARSTSANSSSFFSKIKTLFATTGVVLASLVALNLWLEGGEFAPGERISKEVEPVILKPASIAKSAPERVAEKELIVPVEEDKMIESSWLKGLLWSNK